ncbi:glycoside hydrolase domain-containing protein [Streptacidiphilus sp. EB129]|uniref:glycoside hydrolase domain-containing protein n=1 Tax=Streptacidiphilus sp. EB129 TaxID=3156262 RepID=UPI003514148B
MVLEAQQWVNATYGSVVGYSKVTEDGATGWSTMYALTRALQHELGIATLSNSFGPTTLAALQSRGGITLDEKNQNLVKIIQSALFCKGYAAGGINGSFNLPTQLAVTSLMSNAGLGDALHGVVQPKVMKALLTMDAYVVVAGGKQSVRSVQQWLNGHYIGRANFFVIPCDGIFSRDVQKALYLAIQYELGMTDSQATGAFGPGTQAGLQAHLLSQGATGVFVNIFSAAVVFNQVVLPDDSVYSAFTSTFDGGLAAAVNAFQSFSELPVNGTADFATWCELLVSTGDASRPGTAFDCVTTITSDRAKALTAAGYRVVGRYLDEPANSTLHKKIQPGELLTIFMNGLKVFPISQYYGGQVSYFTYTQGYQDALGAHNAATGYGFDIGTVIYFAVDYDATQADIDSNIVPYFQGIVAGLASQGKKYIHGVYGSRNVCQQVTLRTYARWSFVSGMSTGFSGNMGFALPSNWSFNQVQTLTVGSGTGAIEIDKDIAKPGTDPAVSSVNDPGNPVNDFIAYIGALYQLAVNYKGTRNPNQLVLEYLRHADYDNMQWQKLIGDVDQGFTSYVDSHDITLVKVSTVKDPFYGIDLHVSHLGAAANGVLLLGKPSGTATNRGDVAGWGGDWMTFYGEWRRDSASYSSGATYCQERLAKLSAIGTFKLRDLTEDADGYLIAMRVLGGENIVDVVQDHYTKGYLTRFQQFFQGRFGGTAANAKAIAGDMLTSDRDALIVAGRTYLIETTGGIPTLDPSMLPSDKLDEFCQGFADMLLAKVGEENSKAKALMAKLRAAGRM